MITVKDSDLRNAANKGAADFLGLIIKSIKDAIGGELTVETMSSLNGFQNTLLAYDIFRNEVMEGGFVQLIQNGYGTYIFMNPFAKSMRIFGADRLATLINKANKIYRANREDLEKERSDDEFMAMYEKYEKFDALQDEFIEDEPAYTEIIAEYVDSNLDRFVEIVDK